ncbi:MAG: biotin--[Clostridia bacterium]|nr:biotin--[acetyl-CoA-carboxylase] ligase [Clostridia bacterium]
LAAGGAPQFTVVQAEYQSKGKGRLGRSFFSPQGTGLYFSIILRPTDLPIEDTLFITTAAAAAVAESIEQICGKACGIKWVNDLFLGGRKICGILTEAAFRTDLSGLEYAVLGIGVNIAPPVGGFPEELQTIANTIYDDPMQVPEGLREQLLAGILDRFYAYYTRFPNKDFLESYRCRSILTGKAVTVHRGDQQYPAHVVGIDDRCRLLVEQDGIITALDSGEVSIRF